MGKNTAKVGCCKHSKNLGGKLPYLFFATLESTCGQARVRTHTLPQHARRKRSQTKQSLSPSHCRPTPSAHPSPFFSSATHSPSHRLPSAQRPTDARTNPPSVGPPASPEGAPQAAPAAIAALGNWEKSSAQPTSEPTDHRPTSTPSPFSLPRSGGPKSVLVQSTLQPA